MDSETQWQPFDSRPNSKLSIVISLVLDELNASRENAFRDLYRRPHVRLEDSAFDAIRDEEASMKNLALVCRSWSPPALRMLGRSLVLYNPSAESISSTRLSRTFGSWTKYLTLVITEAGSAEDSALWEEMRSLFDCISSVQHLYFAGKSKRNDERFLLVDSLSSVLAGLHELKACTISRSCTITTNFSKPVVYPALFAALNKKPRLEQLNLHDFTPIPNNEKSHCLSAICYDPLGDACFRFSQAIYPQSVPSMVFVPFVSFKTRPDDGKDINYYVHSMQLSKIDLSGTHASGSSIIDPNMSILERLEELDISSMVFLARDDDDIWWTQFASSTSLRFLRLQCYVEHLSLELPNLLGYLPDSLEEVVIDVSHSAMSDELQAQTRDFGKFDECVAALADCRLPNLHSLHLKLTGEPSNGKASSEGGPPAGYPNTASICKKRGVEFSYGGYDLLQQPYKFIPWSSLSDDVFSSLLTTMKLDPEYDGPEDVKSLRECMS